MNSSLVSDREQKQETESNNDKALLFLSIFICDIFNAKHGHEAVMQVKIFSQQPHDNHKLNNLDSFPRPVSLWTVLKRDVFY